MIQCLRIKVLKIIVVQILYQFVVDPSPKNIDYSNQLTTVLNQYLCPNNSILVSKTIWLGVLATELFALTYENIT